MPDHSTSSWILLAPRLTLMLVAWCIGMAALLAVVTAPPVGVYLLLSGVSDRLAALLAVVAWCGCLWGLFGRLIDL